MKASINFILKYKLHHFLFWLVYYVVWVLVYRGFYQKISDLLLITLVYTVSHALMYYVTQYWLIERLLSKRKVLVFFAAFLGLLSLSVAFMFFSIQLIMGMQMVENFGGELLAVFMVFAASNIFMTALLVSIKALFNNIRNQRKAAQREKERLSAELQYLKAQVNPHFLFNSINSVYVLIKKDPEKASDALIKLSDLLRSQLYDFGSDKISISQELAYLENFIDLERLRKGDKLLLDFQKGSGLMGFEIAPFMLIPFLENCFKHVGATDGQPKQIIVSLEHANNKFNAYFFNTKNAASNGKPNEPNGIGLNNIRRRLELLYNGKYNLEINNKSHSYEVSLTLDIDER